MSEAIDIVEGIRSGDKEAEQRLVSNYWRNLYFILSKRTGDQGLAADLTQEAFIIVIKKARKGEILNPAALPSFIRQVGVNLLIADYRRKEARKTDTYTDLDAVLDATKDDAFSKLSSQKLCEQVIQLMSELPIERDRDLLTRHFVHAQDKSTICQELDLSPANFDRILHRARSRLKQILLIKTGLDLNTQSIAYLLSIVLICGVITQKISFHDNYLLGESEGLLHLGYIDRQYPAPMLGRGRND